MLILLCSANTAVLKRWEGFLAGQCQIERTQSLSELKSRCASGQFDLVLLHRLLVDMAAFSELRGATPSARFFLLSDQPSEDEGISFLKLGIVGYGNTYISSARLEEALRVVAAGGVWLGQKVIQRLIAETYQKGKETAVASDAEQILTSLTPAERKVAELVARGQSNLEIAADLAITERTVKAHLTSVYEKTKTGSRLSLALLINQR